jgi:hypothetical protein
MARAIPVAQRHGNGARRRQAAKIEAGASDDIGHAHQVRRRQPQRIQRPPKIVEPRPRDMRQHQVLAVGHPDFAVTVLVGQVGKRFHLVRAHVARNATDRFQGNGNRGVTRLFVGEQVAGGPAGEGGILHPLGREQPGIDRLVGRRRELRANARDFRLVQAQR